MDIGYIENGFIVDLTNARKTSEIIYELARILDIPEAKSKQICLKLGNIDLTQTELVSIEALVNSMDSAIEFITTESDITKSAAEELEIKVSKIENEIVAPDFQMEKPVSEEVETALDKIFGDNDFEAEPVIEEAEKVDEPEFIEEETEETIAMKSEIENLPTLYFKKTVRSGQSIKSDGNLFVLGDVNPGAEIIAKGDITVWGVLGGLAHSGSDGNTQTRIRALKMNAIQLRIADIVARRPDGANTPFVQKTDEFVPEEARIRNKSIIISKFTEN